MLLVIFLYFMIYLIVSNHRRLLLTAIRFFGMVILNIYYQDSHELLGAFLNLIEANVLPHLHLLHLQHPENVKLPRQGDPFC